MKLRRTLCRILIRDMMTRESEKWYVYQHKLIDCAWCHATGVFVFPLVSVLNISDFSSNFPFSEEKFKLKFS